MACQGQSRSNIYNGYLWFLDDVVVYLLDFIFQLRGCLPDGIEIIDILMMVRGPLLVNDKEIRASAVKIIRYCLNTPDDVHRFVDTCLPTLIVRIIDTNYDENSFQDREHALKLIRYVNRCRKTYQLFMISLY